MPEIITQQPDLHWEGHCFQFSKDPNAEYDGTLEQYSSSSADATFQRWYIYSPEEDRPNSAAESDCVYNFGDGREITARSHYLSGMEDAWYVQANEEVEVTFGIPTFPKPASVEREQIDIGVQTLSPEALKQPRNLTTSFDLLYGAKTGKMNAFRIYHSPKRGELGEAARVNIDFSDRSIRFKVEDLTEGVQIGPIYPIDRSTLLESQGRENFKYGEEYTFKTPWGEYIYMFNEFKPGIISLIVVEPDGLSNEVQVPLALGKNISERLRDITTPRHWAGMIGYFNRFTIKNGVLPPQTFNS